MSKRINRLWKLILFFLLIIYILLSIQLYHCKLSDKVSFLNKKHRIRATTHLIRSAFEIKNDQIQRAILIFYPNNQEKIYLPEIRWLYHSWIEMMKNGEPNKWRTDLIIFTGNLTTNLQNLACKFNKIRINKTELPQCRIFHYQRVSARNTSIDSERSQLLYKNLGRYEYIDSVNIIIEGYQVFRMYDYILKTDIDVFLTKYFGLYVPISDMTLLTGHGGYSVRFNSNRLRRIANDMGWQYANMTNIGSTWYGPPHMAYRIALITLEAMFYLNRNEFTRAERGKKFGTLQWPDWHYGVLSMYGTHLAVNHLVLNEQFDIQIAHDLLDQSTANFEPNQMEKYKRLHLHCWHSLVAFSKFNFKKNTYDRIDPRVLINDTSAGAYAMRLALESKLMTLEQLAQRFISVQNMKRNG